MAMHVLRLYGKDSSSLDFLTDKDGVYAEGYDSFGQIVLGLQIERADVVSLIDYLARMLPLLEEGE